MSADEAVRGHSTVALPGSETVEAQPDPEVAQQLAIQSARAGGAAAGAILAIIRAPAVGLKFSQIEADLVWLRDLFVGAAHPATPRHCASRTGPAIERGELVLTVVRRRRYPAGVKPLLLEHFDVMRRSLRALATDERGKP